MFNKPSNTDIINRIDNIENKIDLLLSKIDNINNKKCHCKNSEIIVYNEIKNYINDKFTELEYDLCNYAENKFINNNTKIESIEKDINEVKKLFNNYKNDVINNMEFIIDHIYKETQEFKDNIIFTKIKDMINFTQRDSFEKYNNNIEDLNNKLNKIISQNLVSNTNCDYKNCDDNQLFEELEQVCRTLLDKILDIIKEISDEIND